MAQAWKVIADTLQSTAHLLPPPADSAVGLVGTVARLTQKALEGKEASKENQQYIEQLVNRAVEIASIIKKYVAESTYRDEVFLRFVTSFHTTMEEVSSFVANFAHERWLQRLTNGKAVKSQFTDLWRQLDAIAVDFTIHFLTIMHSKGPHELIEHPKLRDFWKHSMTNVHEAKWIHFWDQFLFEFPSAQPFLTGASASANKVKFQEKALPRDANFVGSLEINNLFQPPTALFEEILSSVLAGDEQAVILKCQASATEKPREVHCWNGYWTTGSERGDMTAELFIADGRKIYGGGSDQAGDFTWTGECHGGQVHMIKQYIGRHQVLYNGKFKGTTMDRDDELFATAGVSRCIKVVNEVADVHCPVVEIATRSKLSCLSWNKYIKSHIASSDYEGIVTVWDVNSKQSIMEYEEHEKRAWSVDFSRTEPTMLVSGSDDGKVKVWCTRQETSAINIDMKANICCVKYNPGSSNFVAVGSADHHIHYFDLRSPNLPLHIFKGHRKAVSYVKFISPNELASASTDSTLQLWDVQENCSIRTLQGHTNEKNFVGLTVNSEYIACGSETNDVFVYHKAISKPAAWHRFGSANPEESDDDLSPHFISAVCWKSESPTMLAANSQGTIKVLVLAP